MEVVIADSRPEVLSALRVLLAEQASVSVSAEAHDVPSLLAATESAQPAVVLVDWDLVDPRPSRRPGSLLEEIALAAPSARVIALSTRIEAETEALTAGADAFVSKCAPATQLLVALKNITRED